MLKTILLTGASGYLGAELTKEFVTRGYHVKTLTRTPLKIEGTENISGWSLESPELSENARADILIHAGWDMTVSDRSSNDRINVKGSERLFSESKRLGISRQIFISSTSAYAESESNYGKAKYQVETIFSSGGAQIIRPGLIYGGEHGLLMSLKKIVSRSPFVPLFGARQVLFLSEIHDLVNGIISIIENPSEFYDAARPVLANAKPIEFGALMRGLAHGHHVMFVPFSWRLLYAALRLLEILGFKPPFKSDSLKSLMTLSSQQPMNLKIQFRSFE